MRRVLFLAASILASWPVDAAAEWRFLHTEHFHLVGDVSARQLRDVALRFEQFRDIAARLNLAPTSPQAASPLTILVFRNGKSFEPFMPRDSGRVLDTAGMFVDGPDSVYIAVRLDRGESSFRSVSHEYAHLLMKSVFPGAPPWLNEGMAEFYSTLRWTGWEAEVSAIALDRGIHAFPPPFTVEGKDLNQVSRKDIPIKELLSLHAGIEL